MGEAGSPETGGEAVGSGRSRAIRRHRYLADSRPRQSQASADPRPRGAPERVVAHSGRTHLYGKQSDRARLTTVARRQDRAHLRGRCAPGQGVERNRDRRCRQDGSAGPDRCAGGSPVGCRSAAEFIRADGGNGRTCSQSLPVLRGDGRGQSRPAARGREDVGNSLRLG